METRLLRKLKKSVGEARYLTLRTGRCIPACIEMVNERERTVKYLHGVGLDKLQEAKSNHLSAESVMTNSDNFTVISFDDIADISSHPFLDMSKNYIRSTRTLFDN